MEIGNLSQWFPPKTDFRCKILHFHTQNCHSLSNLPDKISNFQPKCLADFQKMLILSDSALGSKILEIKKKNYQRISESFSPPLFSDGSKTRGGKALARDFPHVFLEGFDVSNLRWSKTREGKSSEAGGKALGYPLILEQTIFSAPLLVDSLLP